MGQSFDQFGKRVMSGEARGMGASILRGVLSVAEPIYSGAMSTRNAMFDCGRRAIHRLPRPVICVGNLTTGGTGKTPVVAHLARWLRSTGQRPAILLRGYKSSRGLSDEAELLDRALNREGEAPAEPNAMGPEDSARPEPRPAIVIHAEPDRLAGGQTVLRDHPETTIFLLDDGFQHRRLHRDFDLVLINAVEPFGFGHVFPRGLLREPLAGLRRASAVLITHASEVPAEAIVSIEQTIRRHNSAAPIYRSDHVHTSLIGPLGELAIDALTKARFFAFAGIGQPQSLERAMKSFGSNFAGAKWYPDHHHYSEADLDEVHKLAGDAPLLVTTEKDWAKVKNLPAAKKTLPAIVRLQLDVRFFDGDEARLVEQIQKFL